MMAFSAFILVVCYATLTVGSTPPTIEFPSNNYDDPDQATAGRKFIITCKATGSLPMTFTWKKNNVAFTSYKPYKVITTSGRTSKVTIKTLNPDEDGKYQCFVSNAAGATFSRKLRLKVTYTSPFIKDTTDTEVVDVTVGKPLHVKCPPQDKSDSHEDFGSIHTWGRKKKLVQRTLQQKANRAIMKNGDLYFTYVDQKDIDEIKQFPDEGIQCFVKAGNSIYHSLVYKLKVNPVIYSASFAPVFATNGEPMTKQSAVQGKEKFLYCIASGKPAPTVKWMRVLENGKDKLIQNEKDGFLISEAQFRRVLHIPKVNKEQHEPGYYKCEVSNSAGKVTSKLVKLNVFVPPVWDVKPPSIKTVPVLGNSELVCTAFGTPSPKYKWYHNGTEFTSDKELYPSIEVKGNRLVITQIRRKDEGLYQCAVENDWGMILSSTWLKIEAHAPKIKNFGPFYLFKGTKAVLACDSNAAPAANHFWSKNGQLITISGRYSLDAVNSLVIASVTSDDEGTYTCKAKNDLGEDTASNEATVYDRTEIFRLPKKNVFITIDKAFDLHCEARTDQRLKTYLKYKWLKDGAIIKYDTRVRWIENQNILKIEDANVNDGAMYTCVAYTDAPQRSEDTATGIADVKGVPFPPSDLTITSCHNRTTTISWKKGKDNDAPVTHFVVEQESTYAPEVWHVIITITDPMVTSYNLKLTAWANLTFRMRAINKIGPSRASLPTPKGECVTSRFRPEMYPRNFRGVPGKANELDIAWTPMTKLEANGPGLHYILKYKKSESKVWRPEVTLDQNKGHFSIPDAGYYVLWEFQISAKNDVGEGPISDIVKSFSGQNAPEDAPKNVKKGQITARSIKLLWDRVSVAKGSVDGYNIYYWGQSKLVSARRRRRNIPVDASVFKAESTLKDEQEQNVTGLTPYTSYSLALKAFNSGGEGPQSDEIKFDTLEDVPGPVADFKAQPFANYIFANWGEPAEKNGILLGYSIAAVEHKDNEPHKSANQAQFTDVPLNKFEHLFKDVKSETRYVVYLKARTAVGSGPVMKADVRTIAPARPSKPRAPIADAHSTTSINVTFLFGERPGGYPLEFMVKYREKTTNDESFEQTGWFDHLEKRWAIVDNLAENRLYQFVTVGRNKLGFSPDSPPTDARPVPVVGSGKRESSPFYKAPWFIILIVLIILLLLVVLIVLLYHRRRGAKYPVGKREKQRAGILDQYPDEEEGMDMSKMDDNPPPYPSQGSLDKPNMSDDGDSLDGYGEGPEFKEDGSFIEEYGDDKKKLTDDNNKTASATFV